MPGADPAYWRDVEEVTLLALDSPILSFARWGVVDENPAWFTVGSKVRFPLEFWQGLAKASDHD